MAKHKISFYSSKRHQWIASSRNHHNTDNIQQQPHFPDEVFRFTVLCLHYRSVRTFVRYLKSYTFVLHRSWTKPYTIKWQWIHIYQEMDQLTKSTKIIKSTITSCQLMNAMCSRRHFSASIFFRNKYGENIQVLILL